MIKIGAARLRKSLCCTYFFAMAYPDIYIRHASELASPVFQQF